MQVRNDLEESSTRVAAYINRFPLFPFWSMSVTIISVYVVTLVYIAITLDSIDIGVY